MDVYNLNLILYPLAFLLAVVSFGSAFLMIFKSFVSFRGQITRSLNMDIDVVKVAAGESRQPAAQQQQPPKNDKELISVMEHLFASLGNIKEKAGICHRLIYGDAVVALEIANPAEQRRNFFLCRRAEKIHRHRRAADSQLLSQSVHRTGERL